MSRRGWMISILNTPFFCHRFNTRTILLCKGTQWGRDRGQRLNQFLVLENYNVTKQDTETWTRSWCSYPVFYRANAEVLKRSCDIFGKSWAKHILVRSKLVSGLPNNGIHHIQACYLVLRLALGKAEGQNRLSIQICWGETGWWLSLDTFLSPSWQTFPQSGPHVCRAEKETSERVGYNQEIDSQHSRYNNI